MRDVIRTAGRLIYADQEELEVIVKHDPDAVRDVAAALIFRTSHIGPGCGATDCVNACDGDYTHDTCPNAIKARKRALQPQEPQ